jgi:predicted GNAT family acetyltransferase
LGTPEAMADVRHDPAAHAFFAEFGGHRAVLNYACADGIMTIVYTGVPDAIGGRGIAAQLTRSALGFARTQGWSVRPRCSYAAAFMRRHPEYADLSAP